jgi:hypothetical protein
LEGARIILISILIKVAFVLKVFHPQGRDEWEGIWRTLGKNVEKFVRFMGIPKTMAVCWEDIVDYRDNLPPGKV